MITAKVICDSINPAGDRITTGIWTYPRFIHSEVMTHRMLAKNSASSRAIPVEKMIAAIRENPAMFEQYGATNKGMNAEELMGVVERVRFVDDWLYMRNRAADFAERQAHRAAKQMVNRALEPWMHMTIIITGTDWHNFFALRAHPAAQPEFQVLAYRWLASYLASEPQKCEWGTWHLPLIDDYFSGCGMTLENAKKISVARCARVSYTRHKQIKSVEEDVTLHDRMLSSGHMSPFEHQAKATQAVSEYMLVYNGPTSYHGCFKGWKSYRKFLPNENRTGTREDLEKILAGKPDWITL